MQGHRRRNYFIDKNFQAKFIVKFCFIVILSSLSIGILLFVLLKNFTTVAIENIHVTVKSTSDFILPIVIETLSIVAALSALSVGALALFASHKIAGPLYRLKKEVEKIKDGDLKVDFTTRKDDQFKELSAAFTEMKDACVLKHLELNRKVGQLKDFLVNPAENKESIVKKIKELEELLNFFKI